MSQRILVVDDNEDNRQILNDLLSGAGYEVIEAAAGDEAVRLAGEHVPDLILMETLPGTPAALALLNAAARVPTA